MIRSIIFILSTILLLVSCDQQKLPVTASIEESWEAKGLLQGIWKDAENGNVIFQAKGDSVFYPDTVSRPAYFKFVNDTLLIGQSSYPIIKQTPHVFWFRNQSNDIVKLRKSEDIADSVFFTHKTPKTLPTITEVVKIDSVVYVDGERYHWYIAINPTKNKVTKKTYTHDGVEAETSYYDNIIHLSIFQGEHKLFSRDIKKKLFVDYIPESFLANAVLGDLKYENVDDDGFHFYATICEPDGGSCYLVSSDVSINGEFSMKLLEY